MKSSKHIKLENAPLIDKVRRKHGYKSFSEFVRDAINHFIGWLEGKK